MTTTETAPVFNTFWFDGSLTTTQWDATEYHPCKTETDGEGNNYVEQCQPEDAEFWTVYIHDVGGGIQAVADVATEEQARTLSELIEKAAQLYQPAAEKAAKI